jgi:AcrR family transcriptional regulator
MARSKSGERRIQLLSRIVDVLLDQGLSDLSLRPLAKDVGSSARLLIYHFGSKEELLTDALEEVRQRVDASLQAVAAKANPRSLEEFLLMFWDWAMEKSNQRYFRLIFEIDGLAMQRRRRFPSRFWGAGFAQWRGFFETTFPHSVGKNNTGTSTYLMATLSGLLHDFLATGDRKRTTLGLRCLIKSEAFPRERFAADSFAKLFPERARA